MKNCIKCMITKNETEFPWDGIKQKPYGNTCKECIKKQRLIYKQNNPDKVKNQKRLQRLKHIKHIKEYEKKYRKSYYKKNSNIIKEKRYSFYSRCSSWKSGAKERHIEWNITNEYLESLSKICYYSGKELTLQPNQPNTISLDRIDSSKGYIEGNVLFCCADINRMKNSFNINYFIETCKAIALKHK